MSTAHFGKFPESLEAILGHDIIVDRVPIELKQLEGLTQKLKVISKTNKCLIIFDAQSLPTSIEAVKDFLNGFCS